MVVVTTEIYSATPVWGELHNKSGFTITRKPKVVLSISQRGLCGSKRHIHSLDIFLTPAGVTFLIIVQGISRTLIIL